MTPPAPLAAPTGVVGVLGAGQLGRMLAQAALRLGLRTHIFAPEAHAPAHDAAFATTVAAYDDEDALAAFARAIDVATFEFENVPAETVRRLTALGVSVAPDARALATAQDRIIEKDFARSLGARTAPFRAVDDRAALDRAAAEIGAPAILKTRREGYDGKGQARLKDDRPESLDAAWAAVNGAPSVLEGYVDFEFELSVIGARDRTGAIALYDAVRNDHEGGILRRSAVPSPASPETAARAGAIVSALLAALDYVGVVGVEFFVTGDGEVLVNEFAPRVHNSGHWTIEACVVSQFEQHMRAVAGWPLGAPTRHADAVMENLLGDEAQAWRDVAGEPGAGLHLYGKARPAPGRKMGHVTRLAPLTGR
ncbi:MAG: 5-(carboxyamino)imidazole ribonucleotide synthase [Pseudomonadota bacterium]